LAYVHYRGGAVGEEPVEDTFNGEPEQVYIGVGAVPPGIDEALYELEIGETRTVRIPPEKAWGLHDPQGVRVYPRSMIPGGEALVDGSVFSWTNPASGARLPVRVLEAREDYVKVDFNHPLAGKELEYTIELVDIRTSATPTQS
jgi:FKBP-type peptidyl-prolyl cis-trans isomerase 2